MMTFLSGHKFMLVFLTLTTAFSHIIITDDSLKIISHYIGKILFFKKTFLYFKPLTRYDMPPLDNTSYVFPRPELMPKRLFLSSK